MSGPDIRPVFQDGIQTGMCGLCARLGDTFQKWSEGANCMMELGYCPVLKDYVNVLLGGCWEFKAKGKPKKKRKKGPLMKRWRGKTYILRGNRWVIQEEH